MVGKVLVVMQGHVLRRPNPMSLCILAGLMLLCLPISAKSPAQPEYGSPILLELTDTALIAKVWASVHADSLLPRGEFQVLLVSGPEVYAEGENPEGDAFLLLNGTESGRLDRKAWNLAATTALSERGKGWISTSEGITRPEVTLVWRAIKLDRETVFKWLEWPAGIGLAISSQISALPTAKPQAQRNLEFSWDQKLFGHFLFGLDIDRTQFGGGLTRAALEAGRAAKTVVRAKSSVERSSPDFWGDSYWGWSASVGVPGLKYTLSLANRPLPQYFWLETRAWPAIEDHRSGRLVNQWAGSSLAKEGNLAHTFDARLGYLRYDFHFDSDAYSVPIQSVYLDDLPALFATWGMGLLVASDLLATRVWMDIPDLDLVWHRPAAYPSTFKLTVLHLEIAYRSVRNFNLGVSVRLKLDNPLLNLPGA